MSEYFSDQNGDILTYNAEIERNSDVVALQLHKTSSDRIEILPVRPWQESEYRLAITPQKAGSATFTVTASDGEFSVAQTFSVVVKAPSSPVANQRPNRINSISAQTLRIGDSSTTIDVSGYFRDPDGDALTYTVTSSNANVVNAQRTGTSSVSISPTGEGSTQVTVTASDGKLTATQTFNVTVSAQLVVTNPPRAVGTIPSQTMRNDSGAITVDVAQYFSSENNLTYAAASNPSGIVTTSVSGSIITITPAAAGVTTVVVTARDTVNTDLTAVQTIPVVVTSVVNVRPPVNTDPTFTVPDRSNPRAEGLREGVSVIIQNVPLTGPGLRLRSNPWIGDNEIRKLWDGGTGIIIDGPFPEKGLDENGYRWWKIEWDQVDIEAWSVESFGGAQLLFRRPPDLRIRDLDVSDNEVSPGQRIELEVEIRNNGPGESAPTKVNFYYHSDSRNDSLEELAELAEKRGIRHAGTLSVPSLRERRSTTLTLPVDAPTTPDRYYYGALLESNIHSTDNTDHLDEQAYRNDLASEERVRVTGAPDYLVESISVSSRTLDPGQEFTLRATVRNQGLGKPTSRATLTYYRSSDALISRSDRKVGKDFVSELGTNRTDDESIKLKAPTVPGVYYYGACVTKVTNESNSNNNCSAAAVITVRANRAPVAVRTISAQTLNMGDSPLQIDVSNNFRDPDNDALTYITTSNNENIATVTVSGSHVEITPISEGNTTITVTASDSKLTVTRTVPVSVVKQNRAPVAVGTISARTLSVGGSATVLDVSSNFQDPDGGNLTYSASSNNTSIANASVSGSQVTITPVSEGDTTITVTASDGTLTATQTISVAVVVAANQAPTVVGVISDRTLAAEDSPVVLEVSYSFSDPDNNTLTYSAYSNNTSVADAGVSGSQVTITPIGAGSATITVEAGDGEFTATQTFSVTVTAVPGANRAPVTVGAIPARTLAVGSSPTVLDVSSNFQDPDGDTLTYSTSSDNNSVATANVVGSQITITPIGKGSATITITASDGALTATQTLSVTVAIPVANRAPVPVGTISARTLTVGDASISINVSGNFQDPDNDNLKYSANSSANRVVTASAAGSQVTITPVGAGSATITITASDGKLSATQSIAVTVKAAVPVSGEDWMPDANLQAAVRAALGLQEGEELTQEALRGLTALSANNLGISDISGLEYATQLQRLDLNTNQISDISVLSGLTALTWLNLGGNPIGDISALSGLTALTSYLGLSGNSISDISALSGLTALTQLVLYGNSISDISAVSGLTSLTYLELGANSISDISAVSGLTSLTGLHAHANSISDISAVSGLTSLTSLQLDNNSISDISAVSGLTSLTKLYLNDNSISDISALSGLTSLKALDLRNNSISDVTPLENLTALTSLGIQYNPITDYGPLRRLQAKTTQNISIDVDIGAAPAAPVVPAKTALLPNYPNPFNPETWIPYQLAKPADVILTIYDVKGVVVRQLALGHRAAGVYYNRSRAVHWDGKNNLGEKVAAGVYFVKFRAGDYTATRKMLIRK